MSTKPKALPDVARLLLEEMGRGNFELHHIEAAEGIKTIAELMFDHYQCDGPGLTTLQKAGLCSAIQAICRWQMLETYSLSERASDSLDKLEIKS